MSIRIIDLIQENKSRFYRGEIRNCFYDKPFQAQEKKENLIQFETVTLDTEPVSIWHNLKTFGQKFGQELFYDPVK